MKVSELKAWVRRSIEKGHSLFIAGPPGCGKSEAVDQAVVELVRDMYPKMKMELIHSVTSSPTDAKGFPFANADRTAADFLPYGYLRQMIEATERLVIFFDDFGQAKEAVQASVMQMVLARAIGPHKISDNVVFIFATNRREDRAAVRGIIEPMKSRPLTILELEPDATEWCAYMKANRPNTQHLEDVIGFVRYMPDHFADFQPTADMTNSPLPRTWDHVLTILEDFTAQPGITLDMIEEGIAGAIGPYTQGKFKAYRRHTDLPDLDALIANPESFDIKKATPSVMYAVITGVAMRAAPKNFAGIARFVELLHAAKKDEYAVCLLRDVMEIDGVKNHPAFAAIIQSDWGESLLGITSTN